MSDEHLFPIDIRHEKDIEVLKRDVGGVVTRFDRHLEIYAQNGKEFTALKAEVAAVREDIRAINDFIEKFEKKYVTNEQFSPVKIITYGLVGVVLLAVLGAIVQNVLVQEKAAEDTLSEAELMQIQSALDTAVTKRMQPGLAP